MEIKEMRAGRGRAHKELQDLLKAQFSPGALQKATQQLSEHEPDTQVRRDIARVRTVLHQKAAVKMERGVEQAVRGPWSAAWSATRWTRRSRWRVERRVKHPV